jgi:hypothetical protein
MLRFKAFAGRPAHSVPMRFAAWVVLLAVAATPTPAPVALQYDEIARVIVAPATPPAPGAFADDYKIAMSARPAQTTSSSFIQTPPMQQQEVQGGHAMVGPVSVPGEPGGSNTAESINDQVSNGAGQNATSSRSDRAGRAMRAGYLIRYTFYVSKYWIREDDPVMQTATITKCDEHTTTVLNLAKKTYVRTSIECPQPAGSQPSTATAQDLGAQTIDGIATTGSSVSTSEHENCTAYVSKIPKPPGMPADQATCEQTNPMLAMYVLTNTTANGRAAHEVTERGHVTTLDASTADPLFEVPAGFSPAR